MSDSKICVKYYILLYSREVSPLLVRLSCRIVSKSVDSGTGPELEIWE